MTEAVFEHVIRLVDQLTNDERQRVVRHIQARLAAEPFTHAMRKAYIEQRKAEGATSEPLLGKFAERPVELSLEDLEASIREFSTEWMAELD
jgi:hypothetical protein